MNNIAILTPYTLVCFIYACVCKFFENELILLAIFFFHLNRIDRSWMSSDRRSQDYEFGVESFLQFALDHVNHSSAIKCPCVQCGNLEKYNVREIRNHLYIYGINQRYKTWYWHGEKVENESPKFDGARNDRESTFDCFDDDTIDMVHDVYDRFVDHLDEFKKLLEDAEMALYPGCTKVTKFSALLSLYNLKAGNGWSDKSFSDLLQLLADMLPEENELPKSFYEVKKTLCSLGMEYKKIHACPNNCILYRKEFKDESKCPVCLTLRSKKKKNTGTLKEGFPAKVVWYISLVPRFKRIFQFAEHAKNLIWHAIERVQMALCAIQRIRHIGRLLMFCIPNSVVSQETLDLVFVQTG